MNRWLSILFFFLLFQVQAQGSDAQLANLYYSKGEFEKALPYYEKVFDRDASKINFLRLYQCYKETNSLRDAEKLLKKQVSNNRYDYEYPIILGEFYEETKETDKAQKIYQNIIDDLPANANSVVQVFNAFRAKNKNDYALLTLERGSKLLKNTYPLQIQYADYYGAVGQTEKMLDAYIDLINVYPNYLNYVQNVLARKIDFSVEEGKEYNYLKAAYLGKIQKNPDDAMSGNMLVWLFIQKRNFAAALTQVMAQDRRDQGMGYRVYDLGLMCVENRSFETARKAFQYVRDLGQESPLFYRAELALLNTRFIEVTTNRNYSPVEIQAAIDEYKSVLTRLGARQSTASLILELAHMEAFYANQAPSAIARLTEALKIPGLTDMQKAEIKMALADISVLSGDIWEASLFYMQVDKDFKYEPIGQEAKFKNARIFYFDGEFDFAQSQLNVLKEATTKLIANDAMELSLLITENYGLDSNFEAMNWYAKADLLIEQHRYEEAFVYFDSLETKYSTHSLGDDIFLRKAEAMQQQGKWIEAVGYLEQLLKYYAFDILADDAVFQLGDIYENHLNDKQKASDYYKSILFDYKGSLYTIEARKRFRALRGDKIGDDEL